MSSSVRPKGTEVRNLEVYQDAMILERMTYRTEHKIPNKAKKLWKDIIDEASAVCDGICDAYHIPKDNVQGKFDAACFATSHLMRLERKLDIANCPDVQAISNEIRAKYDIQIHRVRVNLDGWSNSLLKKILAQNSNTSISNDSVSQVSAVTPVGEKL